jgi:hypothetical protein
VWADGIVDGRVEACKILPPRGKRGRQRKIEGRRVRITGVARATVTDTRKELYFRSDDRRITYAIAHVVKGEPLTDGKTSKARLLGELRRVHDGAATVVEATLESVSEE